MWIFGKKHCFSWKIAQCSKFAVECEWIGKISQNSGKFGLLFKKQMGFSKEFLIFFKVAKRSNFAVKCDWKSTTSQNFQNLFLFNEMYGVFEKNLWVFWKPPTMKNLFQVATELVRFVKKLKSWLLLEKKGSFFEEKTGVF